MYIELQVALEKVQGFIYHRTTFCIIKNKCFLSLSEPAPLIIQREYIFEFSCPDFKFDGLDLQQCISNARLCPRDDIKLCDRPFKQIGSSVVSNSRIVMWMEGVLPYDMFYSTHSVTLNY